MSEKVSLEEKIAILESYMESNKGEVSLKRLEEYFELSHRLHLKRVLKEILNNAPYSLDKQKRINHWDLFCETVIFNNLATMDQLSDLKVIMFKRCIAENIPPIDRYHATIEKIIVYLLKERNKK